MSGSNKQHIPIPELATSAITERDDGFNKALEVDGYDCGDQLPIPSHSAMVQEGDAAAPHEAACPDFHIEKKRTKTRGNEKEECYASGDTDEPPLLLPEFSPTNSIVISFDDTE
jgi:hypothetical protein